MKTSNVLTHAKKHLTRSYSEGRDNWHLQKFICLAIGQAAKYNKRITDANVERCRNMIESRLEGFPSLEGWLEFKGCLSSQQWLDDDTKDQIQAHRHAWLNQMIAEFKAKKD